MTKAPHIMTKAPHIMTKALHIMTKAPHIMKKAPHIMKKAPHIMTKAPHIMTKAPHIMMINYLRRSWLSICVAFPDDLEDPDVLLAEMEIIGMKQRICERMPNFLI